MKSIEEITKNSRISRYRFEFGVMHTAFVKLNGCGVCSCIFGYDECGFEHVSIAPKANKLPTWNDMSTLKDIFFSDEEEVYQIHPPKSRYVNLKDNCLHLWKPKNGKTLDDLVKEHK